ncbi:MAG: phosphoenolpyruvate carboxykinase [Desulfobulbaceae bacterium]|nr:phosphoenolpyruvate carboxykinase [Desulfobulbaceae bacterium]
MFHKFVEGLYDFWKKFDRFLVLHSDPGPSSFDKRPYRSFNSTTEELTHLVRAIYRDICENITGDHPRVYRQVAAGCDVGLIAIPKTTPLPENYHNQFGKIPVIRQVWITPPFIIDPPTNTRTGEFQRIHKNPLDDVAFSEEEWLCYPAQVGRLVIYIYFHQHFFSLGCALANLFELASDVQLTQKPDAIYFYGMPPETMTVFGDLPTVFFDDEVNHLLIAAVPNEDRFGYFGYLKKMVLTLHNIAMMKKGCMPYHGAMLRISLKTGKSANILIMGDTATGKSETLEAFRIIGSDHIRDIQIIADDMGSLEIGPDGKLLAYGTEIGAFIRLDDLQQGYAFGQIDRAIIMSPQKTNARVVLPVTTMEEVLHGYPVDFLLYANNYEEVDEEHPILDHLHAAEHALQVFREGAAMSKGTTTASGLVHSYFANIFGPPQYKELHEKLAYSSFQAAYKNNTWVGQLRTRLGIAGFEASGPQAAAKALLALLEIEHSQNI